MKLRLLTLLSFLLSFLLAGCHSLTSAETPTTLTGSWTLKSADNLPEVPENIFLLLHQSGKNDSATPIPLHVSGFSGINQFKGTGKVDWNNLTLTTGRLASTRKMGPEPRMKLEQVFLQALEDVDHFQLKDNQLILSTSKNKQLTFARGAQ